MVIPILQGLLGHVLVWVALEEAWLAEVHLKILATKRGLLEDVVGVRTRASLLFRLLKKITSSFANSGSHVMILEFYSYLLPALVVH